MAEALVEYVRHLRDQGCRQKTLVDIRSSVARFWSLERHWSLRRITASVAAAAYERLRTTPGQYGRILSPNSHQDYLANARRMANWCVEQGWMKANPLAAVKPVGRKRRGKKQLTIDELRRLWEACMAAAPEDDGAVAVLVAYAMGLRSGEITSRTVRALDDAGRVLWVDDSGAFETKTETSKRPVRVPETLRPLLLALTRDKLPGALLWLSPNGGRYHQGWVRDMTAKYCEAAGVPLVCAHSLRGSHASTALRAGATPDLVAGVMGHANPRITLQHYAEPGAVEDAAQDSRVLLFAEGGGVPARVPAAETASQKPSFSSRLSRPKK